MRQFLINELSPEEREKIKDFLHTNARPGGIEGLYWLPLQEVQLGPAQQGHEQCGPFSLGIELGEEFVSFELLVRSQNNLHCSCTSYATTAQRDFLLAFADRLVEEAGITA